MAAHLRGIKGQICTLYISLHWGSEYQTHSVFKWLKTYDRQKVRYLNAGQVSV